MASRVAKNPIQVPSSVKVELSAEQIKVQGPNGSLVTAIHELTDVKLADGQITVEAINDSKFSVAMSGTMRALINNSVVGVAEGFKVELELKGVGYRAKAQGSSIEINVGYSHPVEYALPEGVTAETPKATIIVLQSCDKALVKAEAAKIRSIRAPENYKGKGIRYSDEHVIIKEAKKK